MNVAVIIAGGSGHRMGQDIPKQFINVYDKPVLIYTLEGFQKHPKIDAIEVVCIDGWHDVVWAYAKQFNITKLKWIVSGGASGQESIRNGVYNLEGKCADDDIVIIHDGIRPFITRDILKRALDGARETGACVVGMPSKDTVKIVDKEQFVTKTPKRARVWAVQTPQVFRYSIIRRAHEKARLGRMDGVTDDSMLVEKYGDCKVKMVEGSYENLKITTMEDLFVAEVILRGNEL